MYLLEYRNTRSNVYVSESSIGKGVFSARNFIANDLILVIKGKKIRRDDPIQLSSLGSNLIQTGHYSYIMPESPGVFLNHSCDPNAGINRNKRLIAIKDIKKGDEITFDYSTTMDENFWTMKCLCGFDNCRGIITDFDKIPIELQNKYVSQDIVQRFISYKYKRNKNIIKN